MAALQIRLGAVTPHGSVRVEPRVLVGWESVIAQVSIRYSGARLGVNVFVRAWASRDSRRKDASMLRDSLLKGVCEQGLLGVSGALGKKALTVVRAKS